jgi:hypothetical protein
LRKKKKAVSTGKLLIADHCNAISIVAKSLAALKAAGLRMLGMPELCVRRQKW